MAISLDKLMGYHHSALSIRNDRLEVISGNIANANTPGYKARDIDFKHALQQATSSQSSGMQSVSGGLTRTNDKHFDIPSHRRLDQQYVIPEQPDTGDGNSVDVQLERNKFLEESMRYQASLQFINGKIKGMKKAISGGQGQ